jgi:hypothetical protein
VARDFVVTWSASFESIRTSLRVDRFDSIYPGAVEPMGDTSSWLVDPVGSNEATQDGFEVWLCDGFEARFCDGFEARFCDGFEVESRLTRWTRTRWVRDWYGSAIGSNAGGFEIDGFEPMATNSIDSNWGKCLWIRGADLFRGFEPDGFEHK